MKVLVTGGAGYIGSTLVRMLLERGYEVLVLDRLFFGDGPLKEVMDRIQLIKDDIRWFDPSILEGVDAIIDLAALSNDPAGELDPEKTYNINYRGRVRVAALAKKRGVRRYVYASTCSVYGFQEGLLDENSPLNPLTAYAKANMLAEQDILRMSNREFVAVALRQATVYGFSYRMRFDLAINGMVRALYTDGKIKVMRDGTQWRPFVHVKDTSRAFIMALEAEAELISGNVFNVGSDDQNVQIFQLAETVAKACNRPFIYEWYGDPDRRSYRVSFKKIREVLGFEAKFTIADGAREVWRAIEEGLVDPNDPRTITVKWYKKLLENPQAHPEALLHGVIL